MRWEAWRTFERFTHEARGVVVDAQAEARRLRHNYIGTEHLLLGLLADEDRPPADLLRAGGVDLTSARACLASIVPSGDQEPSGQIPFTPRAKKTLELALRESLSARSGHVLPHHLLLGLLREGEGVASQILGALGVQSEQLRALVLEALPPQETEPESRSPVTRRPRTQMATAPLMLSGYTVDPSPEVRRLLMAAGARALDDGRTVIEVADVEAALRRRPPEAAAG